MQTDDGSDVEVESQPKCCDKQDAEDYEVLIRSAARLRVERVRRFQESIGETFRHSGVRGLRETLPNCLTYARRGYCLQLRDNPRLDFGGPVERPPPQNGLGRNLLYPFHVKGPLPR
jgi:hypothetical protein